MSDEQIFDASTPSDPDVIVDIFGIQQGNLTQLPGETFFPEPGDGLDVAPPPDAFASDLPVPAAPLDETFGGNVDNIQPTKRQSDSLEPNIVRRPAGESDKSRQDAVTRCQWSWCEQVHRNIKYNASTFEPPGAESVTSRPLRRYLEEEMGEQARENWLTEVHYTSQPLSAPNDSIKPENIYIMDQDGEANLAVQIAEFFNTSMLGETYAAASKHFSDGVGEYPRTANLTEVTERTAVSITNAIRGKENLLAMSMQGSGYKEGLYFHVRAAWLAPSVIIVVLSDLLLV